MNPAVFCKQFALLAVALLLLAGSSPQALAQVPSSNHVFVLMEENHGYGDVVGNPSMPYLNSLIQQYGLAKNYDANSHYSLPNYFWITAGNYLTLDDGSSATFNVDNIVRELLAGGKTWKAYEESIPYAGYTGPTVEPYEKNHNPFAFFSDVANSTQASNMVPFSQFSSDIANGTLPNFGWIGPNGDHNGHNAALPSIDNWLRANLPQLLQSPVFQPGGDGLLILTFDESADSDCAPLPSCPALPENGGGGHIATVLIGPNVKQGFQSNVFYQHPNALRTVLDALGINNSIGTAAIAAPMVDFFGTTSGCTATGGNQTVTICAPSDGGTASGSSVEITAAANDTNAVRVLQIYIDGKKRYESPGANLDTTLNLGSGRHRVSVQAYDGTFFKSTVYVNVP